MCFVLLLSSCFASQIKEKDDSLKLSTSALHTTETLTVKKKEKGRKKKSYSLSM